jgi:hypothetical protein
MNIVVPARVAYPDAYFTLNFEEEQDRDPHESESQIRIRIKVKRKIWIHIDVMQIRNPGQCFA